MCVRTRVFANVCVTLPYRWTANIIISSQQFNIQCPGECLPVCVRRFSHAYTASYLSPANIFQPGFDQHLFQHIGNKASLLLLLLLLLLFVALNACRAEMQELGSQDSCAHLERFGNCVANVSV